MLLIDFNACIPRSILSSYHPFCLIYFSIFDLKSSTCASNTYVANSTIINQVGQCASIASTTFNVNAYTTGTSQQYALTSGSSNSFTLSSYSNTGCTGTATSTVVLPNTCTLVVEQSTSITTTPANGLYQMTTAVTSAVGSQVAGSGNGAGLIL